MIQICAHMVRSLGGSADKTALMKLVYLADRLALEKLEHPISYDDYRKLYNGPAACDIEQGLFGRVTSPEWAAAFSFDGPNVMLKDQAHPNDLLSDAELRILSAIVTYHGFRNRRDLVDLVHALPEWERHAHRDNKQIPYASILDSIGMPKAKARRVLESIATKRALAHAANTACA